MGTWQPKLSLQLTIKVALLGLGPSEEGLQIDPNDLKETLSQILARHDVLVLLAARDGRRTTGDSSPEELEKLDALKVQYDISYEVKHASKDTFDGYIGALGSAAEVLGEGDQSALQQVVVDVATVTPAIETLALKEFAMTPGNGDRSVGDATIVLLIANPSSSSLRNLKDRGQSHGPIRQRLEYNLVEESHLSNEHNPTAASEPTQRYEKRERACSQWWIGSKKVLILDLAARVCVPESIHEISRPNMDRNQEMERERHWLLFPGFENVPSSGHSRGGWDSTSFAPVIIGSHVSSVIHTLLAPAVPAAPEQSEGIQLVIVPVIVFEGNARDNESESPHITKNHVDVDRVKAAVTSLALQDQEVIVIEAIHSFSEHPQVRRGASRLSLCEDHY